MFRALYGPSGFFVAGAGPAAHFRTSALASALFARAVLALVEAVDEALGSPPVLDVIDVGAGRGELLRTLYSLAPFRDRLRPVAVEVAPRPADLPPVIGWQRDLPASASGLLLATEWLDNVPLDVACVDDAIRYICVDPASGEESLGEPVSAEDAAWLARWWPAMSPGDRAEIGLPRDRAWASAVSTIERGLALCVDYGHLRASRPSFGTLTGYREGRQVAPVPDGSCDLTAHVAMDSLAGPASVLVSQREALRALGVSGTRPPLTLASTDPARYVRSLAAASAAGELTDPAGLGGHWWLLEPIGIEGQSVMRWTGIPATREMTS
jgi:SAM-dependent MidA family methyltransferase